MRLYFDVAYNLFYHLIVLNKNGNKNKSQKRQRRTLNGSPCISQQSLIQLLHFILYIIDSSYFHHRPEQNGFHQLQINKKYNITMIPQEDSNQKVRKHRNNLLSLLSLKRSILQYEKSPYDKQILDSMQRKVRGKTVEVKGSPEQNAKLKQSKTIRTDISACTSDRLLGKQRQQSGQISTKKGHSITKLPLRAEEGPVDLRKEICNKMKGLKSAQTISNISQNCKQLMAKEVAREAVSSRVSQFLQKYKSSYRMQSRKLTVADRQHMQIQKMANELCGKLKDTNDSGTEEAFMAASNRIQQVFERDDRDDRDDREEVKVKYAADIKITIKARMQMRRDLPSNKILKERYQILQKIGRGLSGQVYKAKDILSDRFVAIKVIAESASKREQEYQFYKNMQHRNIVAYYNNFKANASRYLVLQYFPYTLNRLIKTRQLDSQQAKRIFRGIANGLMFLHGLSIAHRDIKPDNIVVSEDLAQVKFIDFGLCIDMSKCEGQLTREFCGTILYMPPEILEKRAYNPKKADIWSLGVLLYRLLFNRYPFNAKNEFQMLQRIRKTKLVFGQCGSQLSLLLEGMLTKNPVQRFTILDVLDSKWVS